MPHAQACALRTSTPSFFNDISFLSASKTTDVRAPWAPASLLFNFEVRHEWTFRAV